MKFNCLLLVTLLFSDCSLPPPLILTKPTSKEAALVRLDEELRILSPIIFARASAAPLATYSVSENKAEKINLLTEAKQRLQASPDALNNLLTDVLPSYIPSGKSYTSSQQDQLKSLLEIHPDVDLGWAWLASLQKDKSRGIQYLDKAIALNPQVGYYYRQRALLYQLQENYTAAERDFHQALELYYDHSGIYEDLASMYAIIHDDQRYTATVDLRLVEMQKHLARIKQFGQSKEGRSDSSYLLHEAIGYGYLNRALHFIERRNQPAIGCPDLARALAYSVEEASDLQKKYCR